MKKKEIKHYLNGRLQGVGFEYPYVRSDGVWEEVFDDITLSRVNYLNGAKHGLREVFDYEGNICKRTYYKNGLKDGVHEKYEKNEIILRESYKDGYRHGLCEKFNTNEISTDKNISTSVKFHKGLPFDLNKLIKKYFNDLNLSIGINNLKDIDDYEILKNLFQPYKDFVEPYNYHDPRIKSIVNSTCCKQQFEFHAGVTRYFFWRAYSGDRDLLGQQNFFNHFLDNRFQLCNCNAYKKALRENNTKELYKFYPLENFIFGSYAHDGPFTGINEFSMHLGETTVMADDARQCLYSFNNGKLDGQFYSYHYYDFGIDWMGLRDFNDYMFEHVEERIFHMIHEFILDADPDDEVKAVEIKNNYLSLVKKYVAEKKHPVMNGYEGEFPLFLSNYSKELWQKYLKNYKNYGSHEDFFTKIDPITIVTETGYYKDNFKDGIFIDFNLDTNIVTYSVYKIGELIETETDTVKFSAPFTRNGIKI